MSIKTWSTPPPGAAANQDDAAANQDSAAAANAAAAAGYADVPCNLCGGTKFARRLRCEGFSFVRCRRCGLVQQNPQPGQESVLERYNKYNYLGYELKNEAVFFKLARMSLHDIKFFKKEEELFARGRNRFLDVGCATGALLDFLRRRGWSVAGVEISAAQAKFARLERGLDVRAATLEDAGFRAASFDVIHASHLIEHLTNPGAFLETAAGLLAPGGLLIVTTPNISGFQARLFGGRWRSAIFDHLYLFSKATLKALLKKHGFRMQKMITWGGLAEGCVPRLLKRFADKTAKRLGAGDVMLALAVHE